MKNWFARCSSHKVLGEPPSYRSRTSGLSRIQRGRRFSPTPCRREFQRPLLGLRACASASSRPGSPPFPTFSRHNLSVQRPIAECDRASRSRASSLSRRPFTAQPASNRRDRAHAARTTAPTAAIGRCNARGPRPKPVAVRSHRLRAMSDTPRAASAAAQLHEADRRRMKPVAAARRNTPHSRRPPAANGRLTAAATRRSPRSHR